jgi:hypothetical protein
MDAKSKVAVLVSALGATATAPPPAQANTPDQSPAADSAMDDSKKSSTEVMPDTSDWYELARISPGVDAVHIPAGSLLAAGGSLVIKKLADHTVVALQSGHHRIAAGSLPVKSLEKP